MRVRAHLRPALRYGLNPFAWEIVRAARPPEVGYIDTDDQSYVMVTDEGRYRRCFWVDVPVSAHGLLNACEEEGVESISLEHVAILTDTPFFGPVPPTAMIPLDLVRAFLMAKDIDLDQAIRHLYDAMLTLHGQQIDALASE